MTNSSDHALLTGRIRKIVLVFDDQTRPETTGVYCRRALEKLTDVTFFHPSKLADVPREGFDLYLNIDDGMRYLWPEELRPCAWWAIDTHIDFQWCLEKARGFDFVFAAQRDGAALLRQEGVATAQWLPLACDPEIHGWQDVPKRFDICFVGNLMPGPRVDLVRLIQQHFKNVYVGQAYFEEMAKIYSSSRVVFNRSVKNDINMRVFEALASGSLVMTNDLADNGQAKLFRDGVHLATYRDGHDLLDKLRFYLDRQEVRERIGAAGREEVLAKHTYRRRIEELLSVVGKVKMQNTKCKMQNGSSHRGWPSQADANGNGKRDGLRSPSSDLAYFDFARPEVLALVPANATQCWRSAAALAGWVKR